MAALTRARLAVARMLAPRTKADGSPFFLPLSGGALPPDAPWNWWQLGYNPMHVGGGAVVAACVAAYAQTTAQLPATHWRATGDGGRERVDTSALARILKRPNDYTSTSDFFLNLTAALYEDGNAYALGLRNNRFEISEVHLFDSRISAPRIGADGSVYYHLAGNPIVEKMLGFQPLTAVPAREVLHIRLDARNHANPLLGEPPLTAAMLDVAASNQFVQQAIDFTKRQARPAGVIESDAQLNRDQLRAARASWDEQTIGRGAGGTPILNAGLHWKPTQTTSRDAQLAEMLQITDGRVATVYRVPLQLLSLFGTTAGGQSTQASTADLMRFWIASGLGFCLNHIEDAVSRFFGLPGWPTEYLELDTRGLERSNERDRIEALARGVQGAIYSPNEARRLEDLPAVEFGDEPRVQTQVVPLSFASEPPPPPAPPATPPPPETTPPEDATNAAKLAVSILRAADLARRAA